MASDVTCDYDDCTAVATWSGPVGVEQLSPRLSRVAARLEWFSAVADVQVCDEHQAALVEKIPGSADRLRRIGSSAKAAGAGPRSSRE
jgi:hypothetical protein